MGKNVKHGIEINFGKESFGWINSCELRKCKMEQLELLKNSIFNYLIQFYDNHLRINK